MNAGNPNIARIYDHLVGGSNSLPGDQAAAEQFARMDPVVVRAVRENRDFLGRAVRYLAGEAGVRQFLDVGAGFPSGETVHQAARSVAPDARVVYVDNDPGVVRESLVQFSRTEGVGVVEADIRDPAGIFGHPVTRELIDLSQPVGLLVLSVLHFLADDARPHDLIRQYLGYLAPGSFLALSHGRAPDENTSAEIRESARTYTPATGNALILRSEKQIAAFFDGLELTAPGVGNVARWRAEVAPAADQPRDGFYGGVGRIPAGATPAR